MERDAGRKPLGLAAAFCLLATRVNVNTLFTTYYQQQHSESIARNNIHRDRDSKWQFSKVNVEINSKLKFS